MLDSLRFDEQGLIPAIVQDRAGRVLTLAYMNRESLDRTLQTGQTWFYSRSRQALWHKGETSGHTQRVVSIRSDCDGDALLVTVDQQGVACHLGNYSCFQFDLHGDGHGGPSAAAATGGRSSAAALPLEAEEVAAPTRPHAIAMLGEVEGVLGERKRLRPEGSYTASLFQHAPDAICKKIGEEATEVVLASKNGDLDNLVHEVADLWFHCLALLVHHGVPLADVAGRLESRPGLRQSRGAGT